MEKNNFELLYLVLDEIYKLLDIEKSKEWFIEKVCEIKIKIKKNGELKRNVFLGKYIWKNCLKFV